MSHAMYRLGRFAARRPRVVIAGWLAVAVVVIAASSAVGGDLEDAVEVPGLDSQVAANLLTSAQSEHAGLTAALVLTPRDDSATFFDSADARSALAELQADVRALPNVLGTSDPAGALAAGREAAAARGAVSPDGRIALVRVRYPVIDELGPADRQRLEDLGAEAREGSPLQIEMGGDLFFAFDKAETGAGELIGVIAAIVILLVAFGSVIAMGLPIGMALLGLGLGIGSMSLVAHVLEVPRWAPELGAMVGLGVGIDYALLLVTRHREHLARGMTVVESAGRAVATAGQTVIFAGGTVIIAILGLAVAGLPFLTAGGVAVSIVVLIMVAAAVTLLPAFLGLAGHRINRLGVRRRHPKDPHADGSGWTRWGAHVSSNALAYAAGVTILLLALTAPVLDLRLGFPDQGSLPETRTERRAYDLAADGFGRGSNGPFVIAVDLAADKDVVEPLRAAVIADPGVLAVAPPEVHAEAGVATMLAVPTTAPQDDATLDTLKRLRTEVFPTVLAGSSARAYVGGDTAIWADIGDKVSDRMALFIAAVITLSLLLLTAVFRSVLVPVKAALMNLLSIGAAYGVLVMVFQWGWGAGVIGLESTVPIVPFIPMFMFAILFGLSMDYEVFLLSRVRERFLVTHDNRGSVIYGIAGTGRVITSAALIMISVFSAFVLGDDPTIKMFGLGLAAAILIDATLVRMILVPATMTLIGDANWWLPGWLDRLLPTIDTAHAVDQPEPAMEADGHAEQSADQERWLGLIGRGSGPADERPTRASQIR